MKVATLRSFEGARLGAGLIAVVVIGFLIAARFVSPAPPRVIQMAAGTEGGAYVLFAERYAAALGRHGIALEIQHSSGTLENLELIRTGRADVGLVQTGVVDPTDSSAMQSLGSLFHEPFWIFVREGLDESQLSALHGLRIDVGPPGSGTRALATKLLTSNGVTESTSEWIALGEADRERALAAGQLDAVVRVGSVDSPDVRQLLVDSRVRLMGISRAEAHIRLDRSLSRVVLPEGAIDFVHNIPESDTVLLSAMGELVVGEGFHPALVDVLLQAVAEVHAEGDIFAEPGTLPSPRWIDLPLSPEADRYFKYGPPFLQRYLPFWAATQIDRLKVMLIPVIALLLPLARIFPPTYRWRVRSRIYRWYRELRDAEPVPGAVLDAEDIDVRLEDVARIEREIAKVPTPPSYAAELYTLRLHVEFVRRRLEATRGS